MVILNAEWGNVKWGINTGNQGISDPVAPKGTLPRPEQVRDLPPPERDRVLTSKI